MERLPKVRESTKKELFGDESLKRLTELSAAENEAEVLSFVSALREELAGVPKVGRTLETGREEFTIPITSLEQKERIVTALENLGIFPWMESGLLIVDHRSDLDKLALAGIYESPQARDLDKENGFEQKDALHNATAFPLPIHETFKKRMERVRETNKTKGTQRAGPQEDSKDEIIPELDHELQTIIERFDQGLIDEDEPAFRAQIGFMPSLRLFPRKYRWRNKDTVEEIRTGKLMGQHDLEQLYLRAHEGDAKSMDAIARIHTGLILSVAVRVKERFGGDPDDLFQDGMLGLVHAVRNYGHENGGNFVGYASASAEGLMRRNLQRLKTPIRIPDNRVAERGRLAALLNKVRLLTGGEHPLSVMGDEYSIEVADRRLEKMKERLLLNAAFDPIDDIQEDVEHSSLQKDETARDMNRLGIPIPVSESLIQKSIASALATLPPKYERVLRLRYGIGIDVAPRDSLLHEAKLNTSREGVFSDGLTLEQIANELHITRSRVAIIEAEALRKLKHPSRSRSLAELMRLVDSPGYADDYQKHRLDRL